MPCSRALQSALPQHGPSTDPVQHQQRDAWKESSNRDPPDNPQLQCGDLICCLSASLPSHLKVLDKTVSDFMGELCEICESRGWRRRTPCPCTGLGRWYKVETKQPQVGKGSANLTACLPLLLSCSMQAVGPCLTYGYMDLLLPHLRPCSSHSPSSFQSGRPQTFLHMATKL